MQGTTLQKLTVPWSMKLLKTCVVTSEKVKHRIILHLSQLTFDFLLHPSYLHFLGLLKTMSLGILWSTFRLLNSAEGKSDGLVRPSFTSQSS